VRPLRFGVVLEQPVEVGGGFQQPLNDVLWFNDWAKKSGNEAVILTPHRSTQQTLKDFGIEAELLKAGIRDHLVLSLKYCGPFDLLQVALRMMSPYEKALVRRKIDVVYFTNPSKWHLLLYKLPFISTIFDLCHRDAPEFDEVREFGDFERREMLFRSLATKAVLVIANAPELIDALGRRYGMEADRAICIPFSPSISVAKSANADDTKADAAVLKKYGLEPGYLFYPAQFWPHKNHATLLAALALLREQGNNRRLVLCGSDRGARKNIDELISRHDLSQQISILGFVDSSELAALYRGSAALVMPSYFGPTNLPPLEAWAVGTPVIYPEAFKAQAGDAAILFDYDSPRSLADAIIAAEPADVRERLRRAGEARLQYFAGEIESGRRRFAAHLERLRHRLTQSR
jgi:glycosyltransferase involved in cell wall biosynthesis